MPRSAAVHRVVSVSGGKDSTATAFLALETRDMIGGTIELVMADTGNEHPITMHYMTDTLPAALGAPITIVRADFSAKIAHKREVIDTKWRAEGVPDDVCDAAIAACQPTGNPFLDLCLWKGRFPSRMAQFCTQELKRRLLDKVLLDALATGVTVERWSGERRDESARRGDYLVRERALEGWTIVRPVVAWSAQQVVDFCRGRGLPLNPLYTRGFKRVGCAPCVNSGKDDLRNWADRYPDVIDRIRAWESAVKRASKLGNSTFFPTPGNGVDAVARGNIDERVAWSRTRHGGLQFDMERAPGMTPTGCASAYGLCE